MSKIADYICELIPKINNKTMIFFMEILRKVHRKRKYNSYEENRHYFDVHLKSIIENGGFIEDQNSYSDIKYGKYSIKYSGCEIIAAYNALISIKEEFGREFSFPGLISEFEKDGCMLSGKFGTSPKAIYDFFRKEGYNPKFSTKEKEFELIAKEYDSLIFTFYNDRKDIRKEIHTINVTKFSGKFFAHNVYCNGLVLGPFESMGMLLDNINGGKAKGISLIGIIKKKEK